MTSKITGIYKIENKINNKKKVISKSLLWEKF